MAINRPLWKEVITKNTIPNWHCPSCKGGYLKLKKDSLHNAMTSESFAASGEEWFDFDKVRYRFTAMLLCNNENCQEAIIVGGRGDVDVIQGDNGEMEYVDMFYPLYVNPSPHLITIPTNCPVEVLAALKNAFIASWGDFPAALNHVRSSMEELLDYLKEPKTTITGGGKRVRLALHTRIVNLSARDKELSDELLAIKWLGNIGSHSDNVTRDDVFDALDIVELILDDLFIRHRAKVDALVKVINKKKGPVAKRAAKKKKT